MRHTLLLAGLLGTLPAYGFSLGETSFNGTLTARVGDGEIQNTLGESLDREFREFILDGDLTWREFRLNLAAAYVDPAEFPDTRTVDSTLVRSGSLLRASLEWQGPVLLRAGTIYTTFGRGLSLSLYRDEQLVNPLLERTSRHEQPTTWDNSVNGGYVEYLGDRLGLKAIAGESDYFGRLLGLNPELTLGAGTLGLAYAGVDEVLLDPQNSADVQEVQNHEVYYSHYGSNWDLFVSHLEQHLPEEETPTAGSGGVASYASVGYTLADWSLRGEYKYYRFTDERLRFNSPPIAQQEIPTRLIARKRKRVNHFNDEVGFQLEAQRYYDNGLELFFSTAMASRMDPENDSPEFLPELSEERAAYRELTGAAQMELQHERHLSLGLGWAEEAEPHANSPASVYRNIGAAFGIGSPLPLVGSVEANVELLRREDLHKGVHQNLTLAYVDFFPFSGFSLNLTADFENRDLGGAADEALHRQWMGSTEIRYDFASAGDLSHSLTLFAGRLRGGLVCSSGNCRVVAPFSGLKLRYDMQF